MSNYAAVLLLCVALSTRLLCNGVLEESLPPAQSSPRLPSPQSSPISQLVPTMDPQQVEFSVTDPEALVPVPAPGPVSDAPSCLKSTWSGAQHVMAVLWFLGAYLVEYLSPTLIMGMSVTGTMSVGLAVALSVGWLVATLAIHFTALRYRYPDVVFTRSQWFVSLLVVLVISVVVIGLPVLFSTLADRVTHSTIMRALSYSFYGFGFAILLQMAMRMDSVPARIPTISCKRLYALLTALAGGVLYVPRTSVPIRFQPLSGPASVADSSAAARSAGVAPADAQHTGRQQTSPITDC